MLFRSTVAFANGDDMTSSDGEAIRGFEIAGADEIYYPAEIEVKDNSVILWHEKVVNPQYVRYGWKPYTTANLVNGAGLPASTFRYSNIAH